MLSLQQDTYTIPSWDKEALQKGRYEECKGETYGEKLENATLWMRYSQGNHVLMQKWRPAVGFQEMGLLSAVNQELWSSSVVLPQPAIL